MDDTHDPLESPIPSFELEGVRGHGQETGEEETLSSETQLTFGRVGRSHVDPNTFPNLLRLYPFSGKH